MPDHEGRVFYARWRGIYPASFITLPIGTQAHNHDAAPTPTSRSGTRPLLRILLGLLLGVCIVLVSTITLRGLRPHVEVQLLRWVPHRFDARMIITAMGGTKVAPFVKVDSGVISMGDAMRTGEGWLFIAYDESRASLGIGRPLFTRSAFTVDVSPWSGGVNGAEEITPKVLALAAAAFAATNPDAAGAVLEAGSGSVLSKGSDITVHPTGVASHGALLLGIGVLAANLWRARRALSEHRDRARISRGLCPRCCYAMDALRACPECGHNITAEST